MIDDKYCAPDPDALIAFAVIERARDVIKKAGGVI